MGISAEMMEMVLPQDTNSHGTLLGGRLIHWMDMVAALAAKQHCRAPVVTVAIDFVRFLAPARVGEYVRLQAILTRTFRTAMEIEVNCFLNPVIQGTPEQRICQGYFTFIALDEAGRGRSVPEFVPETGAEKERWDAAGWRREIRAKLPELKPNRVTG
jgi:acyl-CoA hydrolase